MGRVALLFAGQGAQAPGMGKDLAEAYPEVRELFEEADAALGFGLSRLCFDGPAEELDGTRNSQPAVLVMGLAALKALELEGKRPAAGVAAGLSLGEYTAYAAAGALEFAEAVRLVRLRGELMEEASEAAPGGMASVIGLDRAAVEEACGEAAEAGTVVAANFNSPGQVVISGELGALDRAGDLCKSKGARRVVRLRVSGAFHSPLMRPAAAGLKAALAGARVDKPAFPVVANATASYVTGPEEIRDTLLRQLTSPVLFEDSISRLVSDGFDRFVELGPGRVLAGLVGRISPGAEVTSVGTLEAVRAFLL